jgi:hypothetical protein
MALELDPQDVPHLLFRFEMENDAPPGIHGCACGI